METGDNDDISASLLDAIFAGDEVEVDSSARFRRSLCDRAMEELQQRDREIADKGYPRRDRTAWLESADNLFRLILSWEDEELAIKLAQRALQKWRLHVDLSRMPNLAEISRSYQRHRTTA